MCIRPNHIQDEDGFSDQRDQPEKETGQDSIFPANQFPEYADQQERESAQGFRVSQAHVECALGEARNQPILKVEENKDPQPSKKYVIRSCVATKMPGPPRSWLAREMIESPAPTKQNREMNLSAFSGDRRLVRATSHESSGNSSCRSEFVLPAGGGAMDFCDTITPYLRLRHGPPA